MSRGQMSFRVFGRSEGAITLTSPVNGHVVPTPLNTRTASLCSTLPRCRHSYYHPTLQTSRFVLTHTRTHIHTHTHTHTLIYVCKERKIRNVFFVFVCLLFHSIYLLSCLFFFFSLFLYCTGGGPW